MLFFFFCTILAIGVSFFILLPILGDPGAVSRAGRKGATKVFKHRLRSPWVPTLTGPFPNGQVNAGSSVGHKKCFVLLCPIGEQFLASSFREFVHDWYYVATVQSINQSINLYLNTVKSIRNLKIKDNLTILNKIQNLTTTNLTKTCFS